MTREPFRTVMLALGLVALSGCGGGQSGRGRSETESVHDFPEPTKLEQRLAATESPGELLSHDEVSSTGWSVKGELPASPAPEPQDPQTPEGRLIRTATAAHRSARPTAAAHCLAREAADHWLESGRYPAEGHRRFLAARCGVTGAALSLLAMPLAADTEVETIADALRQHLDAQLAGGGRYQVGLAVARNEDGRVAMLAVEHTTVHLHIVRPRPTAQGYVLVRGRMLEPVRFVSAFINQGATRVAECERANNVVLPEFAVRCVMAPDDVSASLDIIAFAPGRMLGQPVASLIVRRDDAAIRSYRLHPMGASAVPQSSQEFARLVAERVNGLRSEHGLPPLQLAGRQSEAFDAAVAHFFGAGNDGELQDLIALTMVAGWDVDGLIQDASFSAVQVRERDVSRWLAYAVERPFLRHVLLSPDADSLAISSLVEGGGTSALVAHYTLFDQSRPELEAVAVAILDRITEVRVARGLPAPTEVRDPSALQAEVDRVRTDGKDPRDAMDAALSRSVRVWNRGVTGFWFQFGGDPRALTVPEKLLQPGELYLQAAATFYRAPGAPWGQYLVFVVTTR